MQQFRVIRPVPLRERPEYLRAVALLKRALAAVDDHDESTESVGARDRVLSRFRPVVERARAGAVTPDDVLSFLAFKNNEHWVSLERLGPKIVEDPVALRGAMRRLLDESEPLADRYTGAVGAVNGLGKAVATAFLQVTYPDGYGVWNDLSEEGLGRFGLMPEVPRGSTVGEKYRAVNEVLLALAEDVGTDLWTLDTLWWVVIRSGTDLWPSPPTARYVEALRATPPLTESQRRLLRAHYEARDRTVTARDLAEAMGYAGYRAANAHYGRLAKVLRERLGYEPEGIDLGVLVRFELRDGQWHWVMRPELAQALEELGWVGAGRPQRDPPGRRYWALAADPGRFDVEGSVRTAKGPVLWTTKGRDIRPGDRVVIWRTSGKSRGSRGVVAFGEVVGPARETADPDNPHWVEPVAGVELRVPVQYVVPPGLPLFLGETGEGPAAALSVARAKGGTVFHVGRDEWDALVDAAGGYERPRRESEEDAEEARVWASDASDTEKVQLVRARRGQGRFRRRVEAIESGCRLTGTTDRSLLVASHIKPWRESTDDERLDGENGLLLSPHVDALFDAFLISFEDDGRVVVRDGGVREEMVRWGLDPEANVGTFSAGQRRYLAYHREEFDAQRADPS